MGVLTRETEASSFDLLKVTKTFPECNRKTLGELKQLAEKDEELIDANNEIGFYVSCPLGLAFTH